MHLLNRENIQLNFTESHILASTERKKETCKSFKLVAFSGKSVCMVLFVFEVLAIQADWEFHGILIKRILKNSLSDWQCYWLLIDYYE